MAQDRHKHMAGLNLDNWIYKDITYINTTRKKKNKKKQQQKTPAHISNTPKMATYQKHE